MFNSWALVFPSNLHSISELVVIVPNLKMSFIYWFSFLRCLVSRELGLL